jgi:starch phosphorylase
VWLNTPQRPMEACGTSGMKVGINGGINLSIPDGWWDEAYPADIGWTIGRGEEYNDIEYQDFVESKALYDILEESLIPAYYSRRVDNIAREWVSKMRQSMMYTLTNFNSERMVSEYLSRYYNTATKNYLNLTNDNFANLKKYCDWLAVVQSQWPNVKVTDYSHRKNIEYCRAEEAVQFEAEVVLGSLKPEDVKVSIYFGKEDNTGKIINYLSIDMNFSRAEKDKSYFTCSMTPEAGGVLHYSIRVLPDHALMVRKINPDLVTWS